MRSEQRAMIPFQRSGYSRWWELQVSTRENSELVVSWVLQSQYSFILRKQVKLVVILIGASSSRLERHRATILYTVCVLVSDCRFVVILQRHGVAAPAFSSAAWWRESQHRQRVVLSYWTDTTTWTVCDLDFAESPPMGLDHWNWMHPILNPTNPPTHPIQYICFFNSVLTSHRCQISMTIVITDSSSSPRFSSFLRIFSYILPHPLMLLFSIGFFDLMP